MKKIIILATSVLTLSFGGLYIADTFKATSAKSLAKSSTKIISDHGKTDSFESLSELENASPIIVRGKKIGKLQTQVRKSTVDPSLVSGWTESEFLIKEVIKNDSSNERVKVNKKITVGEMAFEYEGAIHTVNGYQEMKNGEDYLLFLVDQEGIFATRGVSYGKIPLNNTNLEIYSDGVTEDSHQPELAPIFKEAREKYGKNNK
ncbi:hypothetical protein CN514_09660 [Bacillus sp. AFS001701]|uniref:hypothetical protein n=1 Tax=Bacillus sp. AFS001701 TaxID=2033480 RepID=UPI000BF9DA60|nr:hypothetical protein [Bacillus sp. AFS001701]PET68744.1 hypothetical protein CN514_09660 [Bacillus sp. AFS001701]